MPFFSYVTKIEELFKNQLLEQEKKILEIIRNKDYEEITIIKPTGKEITLKAKIRKRGSFSDKDIIDTINSKDYQNVTVSRVNGKKISVTRYDYKPLPCK